MHFQSAISMEYIQNDNGHMGLITRVSVHSLRQINGWPTVLNCLQVFGHIGLRCYGNNNSNIMHASNMYNKFRLLELYK